jgi:hypothetical protein
MRSHHITSKRYVRRRRCASAQLHLRATPAVGSRDAKQSVFDARKTLRFASRLTFEFARASAKRGKLPTPAAPAKIGAAFLQPPSRRMCRCLKKSPAPPPLPVKPRPVVAPDAQRPIASSLQPSLAFNLVSCPKAASRLSTFGFSKASAQASAQNSDESTTGANEPLRPR